MNFGVRRPGAAFDVEFQFVCLSPRRAGPPHSKGPAPLPTASGYAALVRNVRWPLQVRIAPQVLIDGRVILRGRGRHPGVIPAPRLKCFELIRGHLDAAAVGILDNPATLDFARSGDLTPAILVPAIADECADGESKGPVLIVHGAFGG